MKIQKTNVTIKKVSFLPKWFINNISDSGVFLKDFSKQLHWAFWSEKAIVNHGFELQIPFVYLLQMNQHIWMIPIKADTSYLEMTVEIPKESYLASESNNLPQTLKQWLQPWNRAAVLHSVPSPLGSPDRRLRWLLGTLHFLSLPSTLGPPPSCSEHQGKQLTRHLFFTSECTINMQ